MRKEKILEILGKIKLEESKQRKIENNYDKTKSDK